ncbi:MAG: hypothetical protein GY826_39135 [Fuerstiella sp.]|nr:hypothetical protein [Fuerstiella sp.]
MITKVDKPDVRGRTEAGFTLTINDAIIEWFDPYRRSPTAMLVDHHHDTTATIFTNPGH